MHVAIVLIMHDTEAELSGGEKDPAADAVAGGAIGSRKFKCARTQTAYAAMAQDSFLRPAGHQTCGIQRSRGRVHALHTHVCIARPPPQCAGHRHSHKAVRRACACASNCRVGHAVAPFRSSVSPLALAGFLQHNQFELGAIPRPHRTSCPGRDSTRIGHAETPFPAPVTRWASPNDSSSIAVRGA